MPLFRATVYYEGKEGLLPPLIRMRIIEQMALDKEDFKQSIRNTSVYPVSFGPISMKKEG